MTRVNEKNFMAALRKSHEEALHMYAVVDEFRQLQMSARAFSFSGITVDVEQWKQKLDRVFKVRKSHVVSPNAWALVGDAVLLAPPELHAISAHAATRHLAFTIILELLISLPENARTGLSSLQEIPGDVFKDAIEGAVDGVMLPDCNGMRQLEVLLIREFAQAPRFIDALRSLESVEQEPEAPLVRKGLPPSRQLAYRAFHFATEEQEKVVTTREAYEWLKNCPIPELPDWFEEYDLPIYSTWKTYVAEAKRFFRENEPDCPTGEPGHSIVPQSAIEPTEREKGSSTGRPNRLDWAERIRELVSDLFTATPGKARDGLWVDVAKTLQKLGVSEERIKAFRQESNFQGLLELADNILKASKK